MPYFSVSRQKVAYFNILRQKYHILTFCDKTFSPIFSLFFHFLAAPLPRCNNLCYPGLVWKAQTQTLHWLVLLKVSYWGGDVYIELLEQLKGRCTNNDSSSNVELNKYKIYKVVHKVHIVSIPFVNSNYTSQLYQQEQWNTKVCSKSFDKKIIHQNLLDQHSKCYILSEAKKQ